jgi:two-component system, OmpR family, KDP operon response regulator KdpE
LLAAHRADAAAGAQLRWHAQCWRLVIVCAASNVPGESAVLIVEDEIPIRRFLRTTLRAHGFRVMEADTIAAAERSITRDPPDAILLDLGLPDGEGLDLLRWLRAWSTVPVIIVSARERERDKIDALDAGADDYVTKPFSPSEVVARIRVAIRHALLRSPTRDEAPILECGPIRVDCSRHEVSRAGEAVHLTPIEFQLLVLLMRDVGALIPYAQMMSEVLGVAPEAHYHALRVHMSALRRKLEANPTRPRLLLTATGVGYRMCGSANAP